MMPCAEETMIGPGESARCQQDDGHDGDHVVEWKSADGVPMRSTWAVLEE